MTWAHGPVVTRRRLGGELKRLRDAKGLKLEDVASALECSTSKISRLETGKGIPRWRDVRDLLDLYEVDGERRERVLEWAETGRAKMWWQKYADVLRVDTATYVELEWDAARIRAFEPYVIHGLLQTAEYARVVLDRAWSATRAADDVDRMIEVRLKRQEALRASHGLRYHCVLDESTLYREIGSRAILRAQIEHLVTMARADHIDVTILPFSAGLVAESRSPFVMLEFDEDLEQTVVYLERADRSRFLSAPDEVGPYDRRFAAVADVALPQEESIALMERAALRLADG